MHTQVCIWCIISFNWTLLYFLEYVKVFLSNACYIAWPSINDFLTLMLLMFCLALSFNRSISNIIYFYDRSNACTNMAGYKYFYSINTKILAKKPGKTEEKTMEWPHHLDCYNVLSLPFHRMLVPNCICKHLSCFFLWACTHGKWIQQGGAEGAAAGSAQGEFEDSLSLSLSIDKKSAMTGEIMSSHHCFLMLRDTKISLFFVFSCLCCPGII